MVPRPDMFSPAIRDLVKPQWLNVIRILKEHGGRSIPSICEISGSSYMTVKAHCEELTKRGYLSRTRLPRTKTGRPEIEFSLTRQAQDLFMTAERPLSLGLLAEAKSLYGEIAPERMIRQWLGRISKPWQSSLQVCSSLEERVEKLAELRTKEGWLSRRLTSPIQLIDHHHPLHLILREYPRTKVIETRILEDLLGHRLLREEIFTGRNSPPAILYKFE